MNSIVIVGGGTAGWMAALAIASRYPEKRITVVDPKSISPMGVGESVTGVVFSFVNDPLHGLSKGDFFRHCDVTLKAGIWYKDWQGPGTEYLTPIDSPPSYFKHFYPTHIEDFYALVAAEGKRLGDIQFYSYLMRERRTDFYRNPDGSVNASRALMSCHFDSVKFAAWLREIVAQRPNITHIDDVFESFQQDAHSGHVTTIRTRGGLTIEGDFFLDCTGFHRQLLGKAYEPKWKSYADYIRVDSAIPVQVPHPPGTEMPTYTLAHAMKNGWMWQIPTQSRLGQGYLFSSRYVSDEDAIADLRTTGIDPGDSPRIIRFNPGRFEQQWIGNVCAVGLAGGFIEPLEASTIHGTYVQIRLLAELFVPFLTREAMPSMAAQYNRLMGEAMDDYVDFISFHYHTGRCDTPFWSDYQKPSAMTQTNQVRMEKWRHAFPIREDFAGIFTQRIGLTVGQIIWAPMLCGLGLLHRAHAHRMVQICPQPQMLRENVERYAGIRNQMIPTALTHSEAIAYLREQP
jgi:flavin-dependent dehydrogenase